MKVTKDEKIDSTWVENSTIYEITLDAPPWARKTDGSEIELRAATLPALESKRGARSLLPRLPPPPGLRLSTVWSACITRRNPLCTVTPRSHRRAIGSPSNNKKQRGKRSQIPLSRQGKRSGREGRQEEEERQWGRSFNLWLDYGFSVVYGVFLDEIRMPSILAACAG